MTYVPIGISGDRKGISTWVGAAADSKPTGLVPGSKVYAYDTQVWYITYDGDNWAEYWGEGGLSTHAADLDAHTYNMFSDYKTGVYIPSPFAIQYTGTPTALDANSLYAIPFPVVRALTLNGLGIYITTLDEGKSIRLGIYSPGTNQAPGALLIDGGTASVGTTGSKLIVINQAITILGMYWLAFVTDGTPSVYRLDYYLTPMGDSATSVAVQKGHCYAAFVYAALPDPFPAATFANQTWKMGYKIASLD